jgi:hypothetical protein
MAALRCWHRLAFVVVLCLAAAACAGGAGAGQAGGQEQTAAGQPSGRGPSAGGGGQASAGGGGQTSGGGGAPGAPSNRGNGAQAKGGPMKLPAFQEIGPATVDDEKAKIVAAIRAAAIQAGCEHRDGLCGVEVVVEARDGADTHACFAGTSPDTRTEGTVIDPDSTFTIYSGPGECRATEPGLEQADPTGSTEGGPPSSETTVPTEDGQPPSTS